MAEKKTAIIRILQILQRNTDVEHPMTATDIGEKLLNDYDLVMERKAINDNIHILMDAGYDINHIDRRGYYFNGTFTNGELRLLIDSVLSSKHVSARHAQEIMGKIASLSDKHFQNEIAYVHSVTDWDRTENLQLFDTIDLISEAIRTNRQIQFDYNKFGWDKKLHRTRTHRVSPYQMILHNQRYYLMAYSENWKGIVYFRLDRITGVTTLEDALTPYRSLPGCSGGINYKELSTQRPYMFSDKPELVVFIADEEAIDQIVDWFGKDIRIEKYAYQKYKVSLTVSKKAMQYWALQYVDKVNVLSPQSLVDDIRTSLKNGLKKY